MCVRACETSQSTSPDYENTEHGRTHRKHHSDDTPDQSHRSARTGLPEAPGSILGKSFALKQVSVRAQWASCMCGKSWQDGEGRMVTLLHVGSEVTGS